MRGDGAIDADETDCLEGIAAWMKVNADGGKSPQGAKVRDVQLLGDPARMQWRQTDDALVVTCPEKLPSRYISTFKVTLTP